jgi:ABC-type Fe3+ transport system substrate-binding protein
MSITPADKLAAAKFISWMMSDESQQMEQRSNEEQHEYAKAHTARLFAEHREASCADLKRELDILTDRLKRG